MAVCKPRGRHRRQQLCDSKGTVARQRTRVNGRATLRPGLGVGGEGRVLYFIYFISNDMPGLNKKTRPRQA